MAETKTPDPTTGRIVLYVLTDADVDRVFNERQQRPELAYGNEPHAGDTVPIIVVRGLEDRHVSGQAVLDSAERLWISDAAEGAEPGQWHYPERA